MTAAHEILGLNVKTDYPEHKDALIRRFAKAVCRTHDPYDITTAWDNRDDPDYRARWDMIVTLGKMRLTGHFDAEVIRDAEFEIK